MMKGGSGARLLEKTAQTLSIMSDIRRQNFQGNGATKICIFSEVNFAHPARAKLFKNTIMGDRFS